MVNHPKRLTYAALRRLHQELQHPESEADASHLSDETLSAYVTNMLAADARAKVEAHLAQCDECREELGEHRAIEAAIDLNRLHAFAALQRARFKGVAALTAYLEDPTVPADLQARARAYLDELQPAETAPSRWVKAPQHLVEQLAELWDESVEAVQQLVAVAQQATGRRLANEMAHAATGDEVTPQAADTSLDIIADGYANAIQWKLEKHQGGYFLRIETTDPALVGTTILGILGTESPVVTREITIGSVPFTAMPPLGARLPGEVLVGQLDGKPPIEIVKLTKTAE